MTHKSLPEIMLRPLREEDLPAAHGLSSAVAWPHRLEDWRFFLAQGRGVAATSAGTLVGTAMTWPFGPVATIGLVIVTEALQGRGLGRRLMQAVMHGQDQRALVLHATLAGQSLYRSLGFEPERQVRQHQGLGTAPEPAPVPAGATLRPLVAHDHAGVLALDRAATGFERSALLTALFATEPAAVLERDGRLIGYAVRRRFGRGHVIGPVIAPDPASARALVVPFLRQGSGQFTRIDIPEATGLGPWLAGHGLAEVGCVVRMQRRPAGQVAATETAGAGCFALASQAFG
jgi:GNAT superfamily N-acetyltransferase